MKRTIFLWLMTMLTSGILAVSVTNAQEGKKLPPQSPYLLSDSSPKSEEDALTIARSIYGQGKVELAISFLRNQLTRFPGSIAISEQLIEYYLEKNDLDAAIQTLQKIVQLRPNDATSWARLGELYTWNEQQEKAILAYERSLALEPDNLSAMKKLYQLYTWNNREADAFTLQKRILEKEPNNLDLWKQRGIQARWLNKNQEAINAFKNILRLDPQNEEAFFLLGETFLWENESEKAEICFNQTLRLNPNNAKARYYLGQILQWRPFGWWEAKHHYKQALKLDPANQEPRESLREIRKSYGPLLSTQFQHIQDSNKLGKTIGQVEYGRYISGRTLLTADLLFRELRESKTTGRFSASGSGFQLKSLWHMSTHTRLALTGGMITYSPFGNFGIAGIEWQQTLADQEGFPGHWYSTLSLNLDQVLDGVLAVHQRIMAKKIRHSFYWEPIPPMRIGTDLSYGWYSDGNEKLSLYFLGRYRFWHRDFDLFFDFLYSLEDCKRYYPETIPYWTPQNFWTRSLGVTLQYAFWNRCTLESGYALTVQPGNEYANNVNVKLEFQFNDFFKGFTHYQDFGSSFYSFQSIQFGLSYRF